MDDVAASPSHPGAWPSATSRTVDLDGPVHYLDYGGGAVGGPTFVLVHGLGGSHLNWDLLAPLLAPHGRVLALDLPGFGRSEPGGRPADVPASVALVERFLREVAGGSVVLVGNSMGGTISLFVAARAPALVRGLVLLDPAVPGGGVVRDPLVAAQFALYPVPLLAGVGQWLYRRHRSPLQRTRDVLRLCGVDPDALPPELISRSVALLEERRGSAGLEAGMDRSFLTAARSLLWVLARRGSYAAVMAAVDGPVLLVHGDRDRLIPVAAARELAERQPGWRYRELAGVGHMPQLQVPGAVADEIVGWLVDAGLAGASGPS